MSELKIEYRHPSSLQAYQRNSRTHSGEQVAQLVASIKEFGFTNPVLIDAEGVLIAGHGRVQAAIAAELTSIPTITLGHLTAAQRKALVIADNQIATNAGWSMEMLRVEMAELKVEGFDLGLTGFDADFLAKLLPPEGMGVEGDKDAAPPVQAGEAVPRPGDVWLLGKHRLVCGDSTDADIVAKALNGTEPGLMVTDPPYGVKLDPSHRAKGMADGSKRATGKILNDHRADWREAWALFPGDVAYVWHAYAVPDGEERSGAAIVEESLVNAGFRVRAQIIWKKANRVQSIGNIAKHSAGYNSHHEAAFYVMRKGAKNDWKGDKSQSTVWELDHIKSDTGHGSQKPVEAMARGIRNNSSPGQAVYDPFVGSGTTIIACEEEKRICHAVELDPHYVEVGILRWQTLTNQNAVLEATGQTFSEVMGDRVPDKVIKIAAA
jgi:DNA modification methylase